MTILEKITAYKIKEVSAKQEAFPVALLQKSNWYQRETTSLARAIKTSSTGIIAEHKRRSPSKQNINNAVQVPDVATGYENAGVSGMSVLTDTTFFGGSIDDLAMARTAVAMPLLRKEFIIDPYQIHEAKAYGADAILLIAACLTVQQLKEFSSLAKSLQLDVLLEVHNDEELRKSLLPTVDMLGVNNRNLKTFKTSLDASKQLASVIPDDFVKISESGISTVSAIKELKTVGYQGFLIGETFMKTENPGKSAAQFLNQLQ
ncbi:indole-3-glycerol phosphate synthase TrpC [Rasiella rasia]|uniref:indole-3-glycerol-phosphate synthase n=1 Tax=Rasiella rasia TaxID=2744027 RepID=A0A6G6GN56_9FLAO|nr:indole-3-glycerol phosphate synthase TrpC [Rasiella rasia]QIE59131.1 indole-3-glycerol phosphate synthase TrpC [Rasiella rasia]